MTLPHPRSADDGSGILHQAQRGDCVVDGPHRLGIRVCDARPELASAALPRVHAPTLFIVEDEEPALDLNRSALAKLVCKGELSIVAAYTRLGLCGDRLQGRKAGGQLVREPPINRLGRLGVTSVKVV